MPQHKITEKRCKDCNQVKDIVEFYVKEHRATATRYFSRCKLCYYEWVYKRDKEAGYKHHGLKQRNGMARQKLRQAVADGRIEKPTHCQHCDKFFEKKDLQGHHKDHSKPYDVIWLCRKCHKLAEPS